MKVKDLKQIIENADPELDVVVLTKDRGVYLGPISFVQIENASIGFDWEHGKLLLHPEKELIEYAVFETAFGIEYSRNSKKVTLPKPNNGEMIEKA